MYKRFARQGEPGAWEWGVAGRADDPNFQAVLLDTMAARAHLRGGSASSSTSD